MTFDPQRLLNCNWNLTAEYRRSVIEKVICKMRCVVSKRDWENSNKLVSIYRHEIAFETLPIICAINPAFKQSNVRLRLIFIVHVPNSSRDCRIFALIISWAFECIRYRFYTWPNSYLPTRYAPAANYEFSYNNYEFDWRRKFKNTFNTHNCHRFSLCH